MLVPPFYENFCNSIYFPLSHSTAFSQTLTSVCTLNFTDGVVRMKTYPLLSLSHTHAQTHTHAHQSHTSVEKCRLMKSRYTLYGSSATETCSNDSSNSNPNLNLWKPATNVKNIASEITKPYSLQEVLLSQLYSALISQVKKNNNNNVGTLLSALLITSLWSH